MLDYILAGIGGMMIDAKLDGIKQAGAVNVCMDCDRMRPEKLMEHMGRDEWRCNQCLKHWEDGEVWDPETHSYVPYVAEEDY